MAARTAIHPCALAITCLVVLGLQAKSIAAPDAADPALSDGSAGAVSPLTLRAEATRWRFVSAHGRRGMVVGYAAESLEGWIYPFQIFHDFRVAFRTGDATDVIPGSALVREVIVYPQSTTRIYSGQDFTVRETLFVPLDLGGFEILYEVESRAPLHIVITFQPDLNLMWPGGLGGQSSAWDDNRHAFVVQESSGKFSALIGSPQARRHSTADSYARPWRASRELALEFDAPRESRGLLAPLIVSLGAPPYYDAAATYSRLLSSTPRLLQEAAEHYSKLLAGSTQIETPDSQLNIAYRWALVALDQAYVCNPWLGCGLVAGYGPSRDTRRPQYTWFFGGDALNNMWALEAAGDHDLAHDAIRFIQKYQKKDTGEIFHEISQSAGLIDWFKQYPYGYRHTDVSSMYLVAFRNVYRSSGDLDLLRSSWSSLQAAYRYLVSRIDPSDGLVTVPPGGWGGDETIAEQVTKDVYLESIWVAGVEAFAGFANLMGERELAGDAQARAQKARASLDARFWNPQREFFYYGFNGRGELLTQQLSQPAWGIWLGSFPPEKSRRALGQMAHARWEADWGLRSVPSDDPLYSASSYGHGSVWPLGSGVAALAFYRYHRPLEGYSLVESLVSQSFLNSLGHVPEVFSGELYRELDVSVPEQIWSSGMVVTSLVRGLFGIDPYAPMSQLTFAPHLPAAWSGVAVRNLRLGRSVLSLAMSQSDGQVRLNVSGQGPPVAIDFAPEIPLGSKNLHAALNGDNVSATLRAGADDMHAELKFSAGEKSEVILNYEPGIRPWLAEGPPETGEQSQMLHVLSSRLEDHTYTAEVEGRPDACSMISFTTPWELRSARGAKVSLHRDDRWWLAASPESSSCPPGPAASRPGSRPYQEWTLQVQFVPH